MTDLSREQRMLIELAERKLGPGAVIRISKQGWIAERVTTDDITRVTGKTRDVLEWFLKQMPDVEQGRENRT